MNNNNFSTGQQEMPKMDPSGQSVWGLLINDFGNSDYKALLEKIDTTEDIGEIKIESMIQIITVCMINITRKLNPDTENLFEQILADMKQREQFGKEKYNTVLTANNGRDHLMDAYQEALDLLVYLEAYKIQTNDGKYVPNFSTPQVTA